MEFSNYAILFVFLYFLVSQVSINQKTIINILVCSGIVYYYFNNVAKKNEEKLSKLQDKILGKEKYRNITNQGEILKLFNSIKNMKKYNPDTIEGSLKHLDNFFNLVSDFNKGLLYSHYNIETASLERTKALNLLNSLVVNIPATTTQLREKKIKKVINKLDKITRNILDEIIDKNNKSITSKNFDITKAYVYDDYPKPKDPFFEKNFQIY